MIKTISPELYSDHGFSNCGSWPSSGSRKCYFAKTSPSWL